jgi:predicted DsbA family dithiol-disulfide isomerase
VRRQDVHDTGTALNWYDFLCPFCYVGQRRNAILIRHGLRVVELPFQAHPDIPPGGITAGPRVGPMYAMLEREAKEAGLLLKWPARLPNTRPALAVAEWARRYHPRAFPRLHRELFEAHFVLGENLVLDDLLFVRHLTALPLNFRIQFTGSVRLNS